MPGHTARVTRSRWLLALVPLFTLAAVSQAQDLTYRQPPAPLDRIISAEPLPAVSLSPTRDRMLLIRRAALPPIEIVSAPYIGLAGIRINPRNNTLAASPVQTGLTVRDVATGAERSLAVPAGTFVNATLWSRDGAHVAYFLRSDTSLTLWIGNVATGAARQLTPIRMSGLQGTPCRWVTNASLLCRTIAAGRGAPVAAPIVPTGPVVQESGNAATPNATYQDLLRNPHDEALFEHYLTSQLASISLDGTVRQIGSPAAHSLAEPSPDGRFILVQTLRRPYSYQVPLYSFASRTEILTADGQSVCVLANTPVQDQVGWSSDASPTGLRSPEWRADQAAVLVWVEALDRGQPTVAAVKRDRVLTLAAPFAGEPRTVIDLERRFNGITWARADLALVEEGWQKTRRTRMWAIDPSRPDAPPRKIFDRSSEDRYGNPGFFVTTPGPFGRPVLLTTRDGGKAYLAGTGASEEGDRPFLDRHDLTTGRAERLFRSSAPHYESVVAVMDADARRILTQRQSMIDVPNYYLRDIRTGTATAVTKFTDPAPELAGATRRLITYKRDDGVQLSATLYLPAGYDSTKGRLPFLLWAYPEEFRSASAASQVTGSPHYFVRPTGDSHLLLLTQGYGILDGPTMPIVGEGETEPNDRYIEQLVASAKAAVDKVVAMGVADRDRIAVGGHSYGAFMTANLLAHSNLFRAGIARSGAYNRTLTPFGFQSEERSFWQAPEVYNRMSPFAYADKISAPILLTHGMADNNTGTFPIQSERFFAALRGHGKTARLVLLPAESHGYRARESVGHVLWEMATWLNTYVKPERPRS